MRYLLLFIPLVLGLAACSPDTDISQTSSEVFAGRTSYEVVRQKATGNWLQLRVKVHSMWAARTVAHDLIVKKRAPFDRVEVAILRASDAADASPAAVMRWSTKNGFVYTENR